MSVARSCVGGGEGLDADDDEIRREGLLDLLPVDSSLSEPGETLTLAEVGTGLLELCTGIGVGEEDLRPSDSNSPI